MIIWKWILLENKYFDSVLSEMQEVINEGGFKVEGNYLKSETKSVKIEYFEERQIYQIAIADIVADVEGDYKVLSSWLFDDSQTARDAQSVGIDFAEALRKELGIAKKNKAIGNAIDLPTAQGSDSDVNGLAKKMLDIFPALKDEYKAHIAHYGNFLYLNFYGEHLIPRLVRLFEEGTPKQIKKFYNTILDFYVQGDNDTINTVVVILAAAAYKNDTVTAKIREMLFENKHFLNSFNMFLPFFDKNKKLLAALIKEYK